MEVPVAGRARRGLHWETHSNLIATRLNGPLQLAGEVLCGQEDGSLNRE